MSCCTKRFTCYRAARGRLNSFLVLTRGRLQSSKMTKTNVKTKTFKKHDKNRRNTRNANNNYNEKTLQTSTISKSENAQIIRNAASGEEPPSRPSRAARRQATTLLVRKQGSADPRKGTDRPPRNPEERRGTGGRKRAGKRVVLLTCV